MIQGNVHKCLLVQSWFAKNGIDTYIRIYIYIWLMRIFILRSYVGVI